MSGWRFDASPRRMARIIGEVWRLELLADEHREDAVLGWLRNGLPTPRLDVPVLADLLAAGVTAERYRWLASG